MMQKMKSLIIEVRTINTNIQFVRTLKRIAGKQGQGE